MKNLLLRAIFGAIYVAVIVAGILCGPLPCLLLLFLLGALGVNEFLTVTTPLTGSRSAATDMLVRCLDCTGATLMIFTVWFNMFLPGVACWILYLAVRLCAQLWIRNENAVIALSLSLMSQLYVALPVALMSIVYRIGAPMLLLLFILVWVNDTFAFLTGCTLGRHKLWERISPKKSWEGFIGGAVFTIAAAMLAAWLMPQHYLSLPLMGALGLIVTIAATLGDLVESLIKRTLGVKDSGHLIPGHGGILDRIDSILLVVPASVVFLLLITFQFV
ncbi:MAG: phosphatidate cytidylyltransferase [Muribaculaceae bacterium]|nr:phosphatidate cytidylyltransferase [Muribaculaceae bacterium]